MNKQEFIERLRSALNGRIAPNQVVENVNYYENYINMEIRKGRGEAEVMQLLGDPRLIARTIIETNDKSGQADYQSAEYKNAGNQNSSYRSAGYRNSGNADDYVETSLKKRLHLPSWVWSIIVILIVVVILGTVLSILSFLAPVIIAFAVVVFLVKLFRDWLN